MLTVGTEVADPLVCAIGRALAHVGCAQPPPAASRRALLLVPAQLRPALHGALAQVAAFLDAREGGAAASAAAAAPAAAPLSTAAAELCARVPPAACAADFERVAVRYVEAGGGAPPPLLRLASLLHLLPAGEAPSWVGLVAPELLIGSGGGGGAVDAGRLAAALALLGGAAAGVHVQLQAGGWEACGPAAQRLLLRSGLRGSG
jgi:hypothetical protein